MKAKVTINSVEKEIDTDPSRTLLESCILADLAPPYSCLEGVCSFCEAEVIDGDVRVRAGNETDTHPKTVRTCQAFPISKTVNLKYLKNT